jgi:hypothetical protein
MAVAFIHILLLLLLQLEASSTVADLKKRIHEQSK